VVSKDLLFSNGFQLVPPYTPGTKSVFLNPTDALHGDIGIVGQDDLLVLFSKSGATEELIKLIPYAKVRAPRRPCASASPPYTPPPPRTQHLPSASCRRCVTTATRDASPPRRAVSAAHFTFFHTDYITASPRMNPRLSTHLAFSLSSPHLSLLFPIIHLPRKRKKYKNQKTK
jgi:hypothetical protein